MIAKTLQGLLTNMKHILIIGGGLVGLSIGYELTRRKLAVTIVDKSEFGQQASSAGAGMLPPAEWQTAIHPLEQLAAISNQLHAKWATELRAQTHIDNDYRQSGSLHLAQTFGEIASLTGLINDWTELAIQNQVVSADDLAQRYPYLGAKWSEAKTCRVLTPDAAQFDNRKQIQALRKALRHHNVDCLPQTQVVSFESKDGDENQNRTPIAPRPTANLPAFAKRNVKTLEKVTLRNTGNESLQLRPDGVVIAAGPWSAEVAQPLGIQLPMQPVRGQMVGYQLDPAQFPWVHDAPTINEGSRYLVARSCGSVIAGSTIEETGFECATTDAELRELRDWAESILPCLSDENYQSGWAGLRPATFDGFPYIGALHGWSNAWVAAGHFKSGLQLSTGTAVAVADLIQKRPSQIDLSPFDPSRVMQ